MRQMLMTFFFENYGINRKKFSNAHVHVITVNSLNKRPHVLSLALLVFKISSSKHVKASILLKFSKKKTEQNLTSQLVYY